MIGIVYSRAVNEMPKMDSRSPKKFGAAATYSHPAVNDHDLNQKKPPRSFGASDQLTYVTFR